MKQYIAMALLGLLVLPGTAHAQNKFVYDAQLTQEGVKRPSKTLGGWTKDRDR
jgi:hypothetical protein